VNDPFRPGLLARLPRAPRKVALVRASRIGDFLCASPAFRALRAALPHAEIVAITLPMLRDLVERSPHLDRFVPFPGFPGIAEQLFDARQAADFFREMQAEAFDLAIQMQGSGVYSNPFTLLLGARATAGFVRAGDAAGRLDAAFPLPVGETEVRRLLALTEFLGAPSRGEATEFPLLQDDVAAADALLAGAVRPLIRLHPAARSAGRRWEPSRFAAAGAELSRRFGGTVVIVAEGEERAVADRIAEQIGAGCLNLAGKTTLPVLGGVISRLALFVTNDTGPAHIAYALGTPTVTVVGGGNPAAYVPSVEGRFQLVGEPMPCRPCDEDACPIGHECLRRGSVAQVVAAGTDALADGGCAAPRAGHA
jgi:ADP-heptose:LPS heptosyltransferase